MRSLMRLVKEKDPILSKDLVSVLTMFCPVLYPVPCTLSCAVVVCVTASLLPHR